MTLNKPLLVAALALAIIGVIAPAYASAAEWLDEGKPIKEKEHKVAELTGSLTFIIEPGTSVKCEAHPQQTILGPNNSRFTQYGITTTKCGASGTYQGCKMTQDHQPAGPQSSALDPVSATTFIVTDFTLTGTFSCSSPLLEEEIGFSFSFPEVVVTPDVPKKMSFLELFGEGSITMGEEETAGIIEGELGYSGEDAGTYGIG